MSRTVIHPDGLLDVVEGLRDSPHPEAADALLARSLAPILPRLLAVQILRQLESAPANLGDPEKCPWLDPSPEMREGFSYLAGDPGQPREVRNMARVVLKFARKRHWDDDHARGLSVVIDAAKQALRRMKKRKETA